jgi:hypothetical protein
MSKPKFYAPRTIDEAIRDINDWSRFITRFPEYKKAGGITFTTELMLDLLTRIQKLEEKTRDK